MRNLRLEQGNIEAPEHVATVIVRVGGRNPADQATDRHTAYDTARIIGCLPYLSPGVIHTMAEAAVRLVQP